MARPVIALLTDFGTSDHYAGAMKGVALSLCPDATLVDITHDIPPHDVLAGALELAASYKYFPAGTIFLVVVDPGVGSARHGIAAEAGGYRFVAPDNGVLTLVLQGRQPKRVVELTERRYARPTVSRTFEGRDRFAPAAAWLAKGIELAALGRPLTVVALADRARAGRVRCQRVGRGAARRSIRQSRHQRRPPHVRPVRRRRRASRSRPARTRSDKVVATYSEADPGAVVCALRQHRAPRDRGQRRQRRRTAPARARGAGDDFAIVRTFTASNHSGQRHENQRIC